MLDKRLPYIDVLMHRRPNTPIERHLLPEGFRLVLFQEGDEASWAAIEASVLEFDTEAEAHAYFQAERLPYQTELKRRCLFIEAPDGEKIATATAWWNYTDKRRDPWLHWVAVKPNYQGLGLGKAIIGETLHLMREIEGDRDFYLHTQTWSHRAIGLYEKAGFDMTPQPNLGGYPNDRYLEAIALLRTVL